MMSQIEERLAPNDVTNTNRRVGLSDVTNIRDNTWAGATDLRLSGRTISRTPEPDAPGVVGLPNEG